MILGSEFKAKKATMRMMITKKNMKNLRH